MNEIKEFKINEMPKINNDKDIEQLFKRGNFLYCIIKDDENLVKELKESTEYNNLKDNINDNKKITELAKLE